MIFKYLVNIVDFVWMEIPINGTAIVGWFMMKTCENQHWSGWFGGYSHFRKPSGYIAYYGRKKNCDHATCRRVIRWGDTWSAWFVSSLVSWGQLLGSFTSLDHSSGCNSSLYRSPQIHLIIISYWEISCSCYPLEKKEQRSWRYHG